MKKLAAIVLLLVIIVAGGYAVLTGQTPWYQTEEHIILRKTQRFFECLKYKEFGEASDMHSKVDRENVDIPKMIEDLFKIPPEKLDIQGVNVLFADIDSSGVLAKAKTRCIVHVLNTEEVRKPEMMLYWKKEDGEWHLKLKSTLVRRPRIGP